MITTVIFDWTGTVVDYGGAAPVRALAGAFSHFGLEVSEKDIRLALDSPAADCVKAVLESEYIAGLWQNAPVRADEAALRAQYDQELPTALKETCVPLPFAVETLAALRRMGLKIGSHTRFGAAALASLAQEAREKQAEPDCWAESGCAGGNGRSNNPYLIFENMKELGTRSVQNVALISGSVADMRAGKRAGVICIAVTEGSAEMGLSPEEYKNLNPRLREDTLRVAEINFRNAGADYVIRNLSELPALLRAIGV